MKQGKVMLLSLGLLLGASFELSLQMGCSSDQASEQVVKEEAKPESSEKNNATDSKTETNEQNPAQEAKPKVEGSAPEGGSNSGLVTDIIWKREGRETVLRHGVATKTGDGCQFQIEAKGPRAFSDKPLVKLGFPEASPVVVYEGDKELAQGKLKAIRENDCLSAYRYSQTIVEISPSSKDVDPASLTMQMSESLPLKRGDKSFWWLYGGTKNNIASKVPKEWQGKKGMLHIEGHYLGAKAPAKLPQLMYNKKGNDFLSEEGSTLLVSKQEVEFSSSRFSFALYSPSGGPFVLITKSDITVDGQTYSFMQ